MFPGRAPDLAPPQNLRRVDLHREPARPTDPVAPAARSEAAKQKATRHTTDQGLPLHGYQGLLDHLATLTRNHVRYGPDGPTVATLAEPTPVQRRAFALIGLPIPTTIN